MSEDATIGAVHAMQRMSQRIRDLEAELAKIEAYEEQAIQHRDFAQDCLQKTHIALGGDGEWVGRRPPEPPPNSGDLHYDVPALAKQVMQALNAAEAKLAAIRKAVKGWHGMEGYGSDFAADIRAILDPEAT